jgi:hypothetical protein
MAPFLMTPALATALALVIETSPSPFALEHAGKQSAAVFGG